MAQSTLVSRPGGEAAARETVKNIYKQLGYVDADIMKKMTDEQRDAVEQSMNKKDKMIGALVTTSDATSSNAVDDLC